tara:strand:+ start:464 stop:733 length:270 start_codon:yes stop_codon:yes gene_type:complete
MLKKVINGVEYEIVTAFDDDGQGNAIAKTIVEDGETAENKYRLRTGTKNPLTQVPFNNNIVAFNNYISGVSSNIFNIYWEDPEPDEGGE